MAVQIVRPGAFIPDAETEDWRRRIREAKASRRTYEPLWNQCLMFAAGKHWHELAARSGRWFLPPIPEGIDRYTVDELTQYRNTILGELTMEEDRPQVLFRQSDLPSREFAKMVNQAVAYGWEAEWDGERVLTEAKRTMIDLGTAAIRVRFDPSVGPPLARQVPFEKGEPLLDPEKAHDHVVQAELSNSPVDLRTIKRGAIRLDVGSPFNLLVPSGIPREENFPWEGWVEAVHKDRLREIYGNRVAAINPDVIEDIAAGENANAAFAEVSQRIEGHLFVYTIYARPNPEHPNGRTLTFVGANLELVEVKESLPCEAPDGTPRSGIHYFHYVRLTNRFFSRGLIELGKEAQRAINKRRTQIAATIDRGQPYILAEAGSLPKRKGVPVEVIPVKKGSAAPVPSSGIQPGAWMFQEVEALREDLQRSVGIREVSLGENPSGVGNYSQLALLREQDGRKLDPIVSGVKASIVGVVEDIIPMIRKHWSKDRIVALAGNDGMLDAFTFNATQIPEFFRVTISRGATQPRSQAAQLKKIDDIANFSVNAGRPLPPSWYKESMDAGQAQPLPEEERHDQVDKALTENELLAAGKIPQVAYYDPHSMHILIHRSQQSRADATGEVELSARCEEHILAHEAQAKENAMKQAMEAIGPAPPETPGAPAPPGANTAGLPPQLTAALAGAQQVGPPGNGAITSS